MGKTILETQNLSRNGFFPGKHHPVPAVGTGSEDNDNMVLLTLNFYAVRALEGLEAAGEDIRKGMWDGEKEEPVAVRATADDLVEI